MTERWLWWVAWAVLMMCLGWLSLPPTPYSCPDLRDIAPKTFFGNDSSIGARKSLVVMAVGGKGKHHVNKLVLQFGFDHFDYMFFQYDTSDWSDFDWIDRVVCIRLPAQMKWWYIKRFVTPMVSQRYNFIWVVDDDAGVAHIDATLFEQILTRHNVSMAQPAQRYPGGWWSINRQQFHARDSHRVGRWVDFVEGGPIIVFQSNFYCQCAWEFIQEDLTSGYGLDSMMARYCEQQYGIREFAVIDLLPLDHWDLKTASKKDKKRPLYDPVAELKAYKDRFPDLEVNEDRDGYHTRGYITDPTAALT
jgi:hypothetical protein